jgi:hypothetical protein
MDEFKRFKDPALQEAWDRIVRVNRRMLITDRQWNPASLGFVPRSMAQTIGQAEVDRLNERAWFIMDIGDAMRLRLFFQRARP